MIIKETPEDKDGRKVYVFEGDISFDVPKRYTPKKIIGRGAYGIVCSAVDEKAGLDANGEPAEVAIKKIFRLFTDEANTKRVLRELKVLNYTNHPNIMPLVDVVMPRDDEKLFFSDLYLISPRMGTNMAHICSSQSLSAGHIQYIALQVLHGLKYLHDHHIIHRDVKPLNILIDEECNIQLCDFGLARGINSSGGGGGRRRSFPAADWDGSVSSPPSGDTLPPLLGRGAGSGSAPARPYPRGSSASLGSTAPLGMAGYAGGSGERVSALPPAQQQQPPQPVRAASNALRHLHQHQNQPPLPYPTTGTASRSSLTAPFYSGILNPGCTSGSGATAGQANQHWRIVRATSSVPQPPPPPESQFLTEYVFTRYYRAPELILCMPYQYDYAVDMWAAGCCIAEFVQDGKHLFPGKDFSDQLSLIFKFLGLTDIPLDLCNKQSRDYINSLGSAVPQKRLRLSEAHPKIKERFLSKHFWEEREGEDGTAVKNEKEWEENYECFERFIFSILQYDPRKRATAAQAIADKWLEDMPYDPEDEENVEEHKEREVGRKISGGVKGRFTAQPPFECDLDDLVLDEQTKKWTKKSIPSNELRKLFLAEMQLFHNKKTNNE